MDAERTEAERRGGGTRPGSIRDDLMADRDLLLVIFALSLALRIYFTLAFDVRVWAKYSTDFVALAGSSLPAGDGAPLYPLFLKAMLAVSRGNLALPCLVQSLLDSVAVVLLYIAGARLGGRRTGLVAAGIAAVYPNFILYTISPTPASACVFIAAALIAAASIGGAERARAAVSGALAAVGILIEPSMLFLLAGSAAAMRGRLTLMLVAAGILLPWAVGNSIVEREPLPLYRGGVWGMDVSKYRPSSVRGYWQPVARIYENLTIVTQRGWDVGSAQRDGETAPFAAGEKDAAPPDAAPAGMLGSTYVATYAYIVVMLLGIVGIMRTVRKRHLSVVLPFGAYLGLVALFSTGDLRHRIVLEPLLILYTAMLISGPRPSVPRRGARAGRPASAGP